MIIGLSGKKSSGKNTVGEYLEREYGFQCISFAAKLKESASALLNVEQHHWESWKNQDIEVMVIRRGASVPFVRHTARTFLQRYGTEAHRDVFGDDFWVDALLGDKRQALETEDGHIVGYIPNDKIQRNNYAVTDARFDNELRAIRQLGGKNIYIERPGTDETDTHASELKPSPDLIDVTLYNTGPLDFLYLTVDKLAENVLGLERRTVGAEAQ